MGHFLEKCWRGGQRLTGSVSHPRRFDRCLAEQLSGEHTMTLYLKHS